MCCAILLKQTYRTEQLEEQIMSPKAFGDIDMDVF